MPTAASPRHYEVAVIGGGSAGYAAARTAAALGARTVIIEGGKKIGGLCILRGCMPSKALLESAHRWHDIRRAREFGLVVKPVGVEMACIQARKKHLIGDFAAHRRRQLEKGKFDFIRGHASFLDPHTLQIDDGKRQEKLTAATFIVATGSAPRCVPLPGLKEAGFWTSDDALEIDRLPKRIAVLGGGVIAVELGQFFGRVGVETTLLQRGKRLVRNYDPDASRELERAFRDEGIKVRTGVTLLDVSHGKKGKKIRFRCGRREEELVVDEILCALGREPSAEKLGLDRAGVEIKDGKLATDDTMASSCPHIFGAGDVVGMHEVVHIAVQQGEWAAHNAVRQLRGDQAPPARADYRLKTLVTFTDPEIASVGLTEAEATQQGLDYLTASYPFNDHGKAMIGGHEYGFVKLLAEKTRGEIIGAEIVGPRASDLIHELIGVMRYRGTVHELAVMPHYHPTLAEIVTYPAEELAGKLTA